MAGLFARKSEVVTFVTCLISTREEGAKCHDAYDLAPLRSLRQVTSREKKEAL